MAPSNMVIDSDAGFPIAHAPNKLDAPTTTRLSAWAPEFAPNNVMFEDACDSPTDWAFSRNSPHTHKDGNVYVFNFDLVSDDESESEDEPVPSIPVFAGGTMCPPPGLEAIGAPPGLEAMVSKHECCLAIAAPPGLKAVAPVAAPPGLEAIAAPPGLEAEAISWSMELEDIGPPPGLEAVQRKAWWRRPCPFKVPQDVGQETALVSSPESRPWRRVAGHDVARSLVRPWRLHHLLKDTTAPTDITKELVLKSTSASDIGDADTTGSFTTEDVDSE